MIRKLQPSQAEDDGQTDGIHLLCEKNIVDKLNLRANAEVLLKKGNFNAKVQCCEDL